MGITTRQACLAAGLLAAAVALPSIRNDFVSDDHWVIEQREVLRHPPSAIAVVASSYWPASFGGSLWRPATLASYALDYRVSESPHWFHTMNVLWAAVATALLTLLACELANPVTGFVTGVLFAVHPVHVEAVANVVGRAELMAASGYAIALICALRAQQRPLFLIGVALGTSFAIASKELAATLPAAVVLVYAARRLDLRSAWRPVIAGVVPIGLYYVLHEWVGTGNLSAGGTAPGLEHLGLLSRFWVMLPLSLHWWRLLLFPIHLSADYSPGDVSVSTAFTAAHVFAALVWIAAALIAWRYRRTLPGIAFGLAWMIITISPVANVLVPTEILIAERTLFLPSFGIAFALASLWAAWPAPSRTRASALAVVVLLLAARSIVRIPAWHDDETHYQALKIEAPLSYRTLWFEGRDDFAAGKWGSGERLLRQAIAYAPSVAGPRFELARFYLKAKLWGPAIAELREALVVDPGLVPAREALQLAEDSAARR